VKFGQIIDQAAQAAAAKGENGALLASFARQLIPGKYLEKEIALKVRADGKAVAMFMGSDKVMEAELKELPAYGVASEHPQG
jgi:uncharacterized membrane protein